ncbi:MAG: desulfoferrodoxin [Clostridiales bacterium]|nr:desulfoferrodoxin [Clostridiales bacterium]
MIFYVCPVCGNILGTIRSSGFTPVCCGRVMQILQPDSTDGAVEKHVPVLIEEEDHTLRVKAGSLPHPMSEEHHIEWILLRTSRGNYRKVLLPGDAPETVFRLTGDEYPVEAMAYCNLHKLWKASLPPAD